MSQLTPSSEAGGARFDIAFQNNIECVMPATPSAYAKFYERGSVWRACFNHRDHLPVKLWPYREARLDKYASYCTNAAFHLSRAASLTRAT
jgi:hypothetical protein